jgi:Carboxypeptidase regulatory-like domain/TonB dependent receptor-like, beta-barrel
MSIKHGLTVFLLLMAVAHEAAAQRTTGAIVGAVADESGAALPGVTVTLQGAGAPGSPTTATSATGAYRFPALPPGSYDLNYSLAGFRTVRMTGIVVSVGNTAEMNVVMAVGQRTEEVVVESETPVINTSTAEVNTTMNREWVENAPVQRNSLYDFINAAPGVSPANSSSDRSTAFGSATNENVYQLDGNDLTAPNTGAPGTQLNVDTIQEVEILSLGAPAEFGNLAGAVFNLVGRQGGNAFHGDANYFFQHQDLTSRNTTDQQDDGFPFHRDEYSDFTAQLGGPIKKDSLWFFASYQYRLDKSSLPGTDPAYPGRADVHRIYTKVNYQVAPKHSLTFSLASEWYKTGGGGSSLQAPSTVADEHGTDPAPSLTWRSVLGRNTALEARYTGFYVTDHLDPLVAGEPRIKPRYLDLLSGEVTGGTVLWYDLKIHRTGLSAKLSHYADRFLGGSHDFRFGVQYTTGGSEIVQGYNDYIYTYGPSPLYGLASKPFETGGFNEGIGVYADDTFRIGKRTSLNFGLRFDSNNAYYDAFRYFDRTGAATGAQSRPVDSLFRWNSLSPRIGINYKLDDEGRTVLLAHYGRYYRALITLEFAYASPTVAPTYLFSGEYDTAGNPIDATLLSDNSNLRTDPDYKNPYTDQFIVGAEHRLMKDLGISAQFVYKRGERGSGYRDTTGQYVPATVVDDAGQDATGQTIDVFKLTSDPAERIFELTNPEGMFTRYKGFNLQATKRMSHHWQLGASLTVSKSEGRLGSSRGSPAAAQSSLAGTFGQNPNDFVNTDGRLIGDRPVLAKAQLVVELPWGFTAAAAFQHQSGRPWGRRIRVPGLGVPTTIRAEQIDGSRRVSDWNFLDLRIQKDFTAGPARLAVFADVLNATNSDAYQSVGSDLGTSEAFGQPTFFVNPRIVMLGAKVRF